MSPTARSLKHLRDAGCTVAVAKYWNHFTKRRHDLFGILDIVALSPTGETIGVQATSLTNVSARVRKIGESGAVGALRKCGWRLYVQGWGKGSDGRYRLREVDVS